LGNDGKLDLTDFENVFMGIGNIVLEQISGIGLRPIGIFPQLDIVLQIKQEFNVHWFYGP
jgi:hypothetical protein